MVAEQRILNIERQKSIINLRLLTFEQKQFEKRLLIFHGLDESFARGHRSRSEINTHQVPSLNNKSDMNQRRTGNDSHPYHQPVLSQPNIANFQRTSSDGFISEKRNSTNSIINSEEDEQNKELKNKSVQPPIITVIPPDGDDSFLI